MRHPPLRQVVVKVAVLALGGGVAGFLALVQLFELFVLRCRSAQFGPNPRYENDVFAIRHPFESFDAGRKRADAPRFAAFNVNQIELGGVVLGIFLLAFGDKSNAVSRWGPSRLRILLAALG